MNKKTAKVNEAKSHFFEKIKKTEKPLATFIQKKKKRDQKWKKRKYNAEKQNYKRSSSQATTRW